MNITTKTHNDILILSISEGLNMINTAELKQHFEKARNAAFIKIILNLNQVTDISSSGIGAIMNFSSSIDKLGGQLILSELSPISLSVIKMLQLDDFFHILENDTESIKALSELNS